MAFQRIIFDLDGTLLNSEQKHALGLIKVLEKRHNIILSLEEAEAYKGQSGTTVLGKIGVPESDFNNFYQDWVEAVYAESQSPSVLYPHVKEVLNTLKEKKIPCGIVSSKPRELFEKESNFIEFVPYFDHIVLAEDTTQHKPHPAPLEHYFSLCKVSKDNCLYVGDSYTDLVCAKEAGVEFALALWGATSAYEQEEFIYRLDDMQDILEMI